MRLGERHPLSLLRLYCFSISYFDIVAKEFDSQRLFLLNLQKSTAPSRFLALDSWRGICALLVAAYHIEIHGSLFSQPLIRHAWPFVDFFFVLSGFVIIHAYGDKLNSGAQVITFVLRRVGRLWPLHVVILLAMIMLEVARLYSVRVIPAVNAHIPFTGEHSVFAIATNLLLVQALGFHNSETWNGPAWSISVEFATYLVFASLYFLIRNSLPRMVASLAIAIGGSIALASLSPLGMRDTFEFPIFRCFYGFFLGVLAHRTWRQTDLAGGTLAEVIVLGAVVAFIAYAATDPVLSYLAPPLFAISVLVFAQQKGVVSNLLMLRIPLALGRWSYSIYMVHMLVLALLFAAVHAIDALYGRRWLVHGGDGTMIDLGSNLANSALILASLGIIVGVSALTYRLVELPGQRFFNRFADPSA